MKKLLSMFMTLALGACVYGGAVNNEGFYGNTDITKIDWTKVDGKGSSCQTNWFFGLMPFGNKSVASAVESADLARVWYVDTETVLYWPLLMARDCTNVYGELTPVARAARDYRHIGREPRAATAGVANTASDYDFPVQRGKTTESAGMNSMRIEGE